MNIPMQPQKEVKLTRADFVSGQNVRWCPGCGDYSILANVQKLMPELGIPKEDVVFISGIGCSSRFPYYMGTYGFHTIHGRAPAVATGLKLANPNLSIWIVTGDGDGLSIGGNHLLHILRRNIDANILLFNNRIYGLTKGQYSPTSEIGKSTKSTPTGSIDTPIEPLRFALAAGASFVARSLDVDPKGLQKVLKGTHDHKGASFVEIYQNCNIFNDNAFAYVSDRSVREERMLVLEDGKPMVFGKNRDKGIRLNQFKPEVVALGDGISEEDLLVHDVKNPMIAQLLSGLQYPEFPVPMGVIYEVEQETYEDLLTTKVEKQLQEKGPGDLTKLLNSGQVWEISEAKINQVDDDDELNEEIDILPEAPIKESLQKDLMEDSIAALEPPKALEVTPETSIAEAIQIMQEKNYGCVHIIENEELVGVFTDEDIFNKVIDERVDIHQSPISEVMTKDPICIDIQDSVAVAFNRLVISGKQHLPVLENGRPIGFTSSRGLLAYIGGHLHLENGKN